jgi:hypothetical protein
MNFYRKFVIRTALLIILTAVAFGQSVNFTSSNLPIIIIDTYGVEIPNEPKIYATMGIIDNGEGAINEITDDKTLEVDIGIEIRGATSSKYPKLQYGIETRDGAGNNLNIPLLGFPEENDWILHAPYSDKSFMRNTFVYKTVRSTGRYASQSKYFELILNGNYEGVYVLLEKIKRDRNRVDLLSPSDSSASGGYLLEMMIPERITAGETYFLNSDTSRALVIQYPREEDLSPTQQQWIENYISEFENVMYGESYLDPETGMRKYIDIPSAVDFILFNEFVKNTDAFYLSTFMYKDKDQKLFLGPVWDFNIALGNHWGYNGTTIGWIVIAGQKPWVPRITDDPVFYFHFQQRWGQLRANQLSDGSVTAYIDSIYQLLDAGAQQRNFTRWPILGTYISPNRLPPGAGPGEYLETFQEEVDTLEQWILDRMHWMDNELIFKNSQDIPFLVINEIHYNPIPDQGADEDYEFIEIFNAGNNTVNLENFAFTDGIEFTFPAGAMINQYESIVIANNAQSYLGNGYKVYEWDTGKLANDGERILLTDDTGNIIDEVTFEGNHTWPNLSGGNGSSIVLDNPILVNDLGKNWSVSAEMGGTPGYLGLDPEPGLSLPQMFTLHQNYPNPFNNTTTFRYTLAQRHNVSLTIYDLNGNLIKTLVNRSVQAGTHHIQWSGKDKDGKYIGSGVYLYRLHSGDWSTSRKFVLIK